MAKDFTMASYLSKVKDLLVNFKKVELNQLLREKNNQSRRPSKYSFVVTFKWELNYTSGILI